MFPRHPSSGLVRSCCLCQCCTHGSSFFPSPHFAHGSGALGCSVLIHGSTLCRQLKRCLRDWSISRMKLCRQDNDKVQRNRRWERPNNVSSRNLQEAVHLPRQLESSTRALGKPKTFTGQPAEWTTWQFTFKVFACATHARMRDVFELATRQGSDPVINSDMTVELQSLSTQLYYMLVMMLSDQALGTSAETRQHFTTKPPAQSATTYERVGALVLPQHRVKRIGTSRSGGVHEVHRETAQPGQCQREKKEAVKNVAERMHECDQHERVLRSEQ